MMYGSRWLFSRRLGATLIAAVVIAGSASGAFAQLGGLISPGPLTKAHANIEGIKNCDKCHEEGKKVSAVRCLACHKAIGDRIAAKKGVHRNVRNDCVACHVEHVGRDAELRPFKTQTFKHAAETGFPLEGKHAAIASECSRCHKTRSFLGLSSACNSCHTDTHKGKLGNDCAKCHSVNVSFKETGRQFDHSKTAFPLIGAHQSVSCAKCHVGQVYKGLKFQSCIDCHRNPHKQSFGTDCRSCHTPSDWKVTQFDHAKTGTPLVGKHRTLRCVQCHVKPATEVRLKMSPCTGCHKDPHRGEFKQDCSSCHNQNAFKPVLFDHRGKTRFALEGKHASLACEACHKQGPPRTTLDFRGLKTDCASCHADPHKGQFSTTCEKCHTPATFKVTAFTHPRFSDFFAGQHASLTCAQCHRKGTAGPAYRNLSTECTTCHRDVHLGQFPQCTNCHTVDAPKFKAVRFRHDKISFPLTGKHQTAACQACHKSESGSFPSGAGTAVRFRGAPTNCASCHNDVHLGQVGTHCETCHTTTSFAITSYTHKGRASFFHGKHATAACAGCHKRVEANFPAGHGMAVKFTGLAAGCPSCHEDPHQGQLGGACESCHSVEGPWKSASRAFHKAGLFPLQGRHLSVECGECHLNGVIKGTPSTCYDCHWVRRQDDIYRTRLGNQCENCHTPTSWKAVTWDHASRTGLPLNAAHKSVACDNCHKGQLFTAATVECASCHLSNFQNTTNPKHQAAGFPLTCDVCHRPSDATWHQAHFDHTTFPLAGVHKVQQCVACHGSGIYKGLSRECLSCHKADYDRSANPSHAAAGFGTSCVTCHKFADASWNQAQYAHTAWQLQGAHVSATCSSCHRNNIFRGLASACVSCHKPDYDRATSPPHAAAGFPLSCEPCHKVSDARWQQGQFDHSTFPLAGVHTTQSCPACHKNNVFAGTPRTCVGCHQTDFNSSKTPNHLAAGFSTSCDTCHKFSDATWQQAVFAHTTFPLLGAHVTAGCTPCHKTDIYKGTSRTCAPCHQTDFTNAKNPNHLSAGFPTTCDTCHKFSDPTWHQAVFTHATFTLAGVHATQQCSGCHANGIYAGTPRSCAGCHQSDYNNAKIPNHIAAAFSTNCDTCHKVSDSTWHQGVFNHVSFPLLGAHTTAGCLACHKADIFRGTSRTCAGCHQTDFNSARNPNHVTAGFPTTCDTCHKFSDPTWHQGVFNHSTFPLQGAHTTATCDACHKGGVYQGTSRTCNGCHLTDYNNSKNPNHIAAGFPTTCDTCHKFTDPTWHQGVFNHSTFPLQGAHTTATCDACHKGGVYQGTSRTCNGCHLTDYNNSKNPNHVTAGFPTTCDTCHKFSDPTWHQGVFNHSNFPLQGAHTTATCDACHKGGVYQGTSRTCSSCHLTDYNNSKNPNHIAAGFPTTCDTCHKFSDATWLQGVFTHSTFPLLGAHTTATCTACHKGGVYQGTSRTCVGCHQTDYNNSRNPNHIAAGFPTTCDSCHKFSDLLWTQAVFNHTQFPITSGRHAGNPCGACHINPTNFVVFSCINGCHDRGTTDSHHRGVSGYRYDSIACYACHPQGRGD